jgi:hypothetical protein
VGPKTGLGVWRREISTSLKTKLNNNSRVIVLQDRKSVKIVFMSFVWNALCFLV